MKEEYLHYVWKTKNIPQQNLKLIDGRALTITSFGTLNKDSGPDFSNGQINIDGIAWIGNIEIHINASDWYKHHHHKDLAYNNVILHVVYNYDRAVYIELEEIPTLELKTLLPINQFDNYAKMLQNRKWIPCYDVINSIDRIHVYSQIEFAGFQRIERKTKEISQRFDALKGDINRLIMEKVACTLGTKVNRLPMLELIQNIPTSVLMKESQEVLDALLLDTANLLPDFSDNRYILKLISLGEHNRIKYSLHVMNSASWKFFGVREAGFPPFRIVQFAAIISKKKFFDFLQIPIKEWLHWFQNEKFTLNPYWNKHYNIDVETKFHNASISKNSKELILINVVIPVIYWWGIYQKQYTWSDIAINLLENSTCEKNSIINNWKNIGLSVNSAKDSQGLLELKNEFCAKKKCLSCKIGHQVLK